MIMRSPQRQPQPLPEDRLRNGGIETPSPRPRIQTHFHSTVSEQKLRRFNILILIFRFASLCFSLAAAIFMFSTSRVSNSPSWYDFDAFRFVAIANAIVALYSLFEVGASVWEISGGTTLFPEVLQVWFDFAHDQVFSYMLVSANSAGTELARSLKDGDTTGTDNNAFSIQSDISIALGFAGFLFLGLSSLLSGFRLASFIVNGSRFHF
ncbi:CASP-like protein 4C2 [Coffea arabica]|nr:CASP-like protein 4C2 [Coffea arabica]